MEHDDHGCRHSACSCRLSQRKMLFNSPDPAPSQVDNVFNIKAWSFTREYPTMSPVTLFNAMSKSLQDFPFFKVWKADNDKRYIDMTTHSIRLNPGVDYHQVQADVNVLEGKDPSSSVVNIRTPPTPVEGPSKHEDFTNVHVDSEF